MRSPIFYVAAFFLLSLSAIAQQNPKVLIIGIDGCRSDALVAASTPNLDALISNATYTLDALTEAPTWSGVGWSGMLTGVRRSKHGVSDNSFSGANYANYPHMFTRMEACDPSIHTASIVHWGPINSQIVDVADFELTVSTDLAVMQQAVNYLTTQDPDILFLHFDDVDASGHGNGFDPGVAAYLQTIQQTDTYIGNVMAAIAARPNYSNEDWLVLVSTDHGGDVTGHGGPSIEERDAFFIASGDLFTNQQLSKQVTSASIGSAHQFNGSDHYVQIPNHALYDFGSNQDFTIECWVHVTSISGDPAIVSDKNWNSGVNPGFVLSFTLPNGPQWKVNVGDGANRVDITGGNLLNGRWHHLAVGFDRDGLVTMYQDGSFVRAERMSGIGNINTGLPISIGQDGTQTYGAWFNGSIAEVRLWNAALEEDVIAAFACSGPLTGHPNIGSLIGHWRLNDGSGTQIIDHSSTANHGTLAGSAVNWLGAGGDLVCQDYTQTPEVIDIAATALHYLCGSVDPLWDLDAVAVLPNPALPVELARFEAYATRSSNRLEWLAASEVGVSHYEIERRSKKRDFDFLDRLPARNAASPQAYQYDDHFPESAYYRLRMVDLDGSFSYSPIVHVRRDAGISLRAISPIRSGQPLRIILSHDHMGASAQMEIVDLRGARFVQHVFPITEADQEWRIGTEGLSPGVYILQVQIDGHQLSQRFVVQ